MRSHARRGTALALAAILLPLALGAVRATPGSGAVGPILASGVLAGPLRIHTDDLKLHIRRDVRVVTQQITIAPGGHTGWHSHPGPVIVTIQAGTMTFHDADDPACTPGTYESGDAFIDRGGGHVHIARNEGGTDLVLFATYLVPAGSPAVRVDAPNPGTCPF